MKRSALLWVCGAVALVVVGALVSRIRSGEAPLELESPSLQATTPPQVEDQSERLTEAAAAAEALVQAAAEDPCAQGGAPLEGLPAVTTDSLSDNGREEIRSRLLASSDPEHLTASALLAVDPIDRPGIMRRALVIGRQNAAVVWTAVQVCAKATADGACPMQEWETELVRLDDQNSEAWMQVAINRLRRGEAASALAAVRRAASAAETRVYWAETAEMLERALAAAGGYSFQDRASLAFAIGATNVPSYAEYVRMCRDQSQVSSEWLEACLTYGRLAERQSKTDMGQTIAREIQILTLEMQGDTEGLRQVRSRKEDATAKRALSPNSVQANALVVSSPSHFANYLANLRKDGEVAATGSAQEEIAKLGGCLPPDESTRAQTSILSEQN